MANQMWWRSLLLVLVWQTGQAQVLKTITLDSCLFWAEHNYPQVVQQGLINRSTEFSVSNAQKGKLPQISIIGQASYQSEVTSLPGGGAMAAPTLSKDQYKLYGEIVQPLTGIAVVNQQQKITEAKGAIDQAELTVKTYPIKQRVSELYFGILLLQSQLRQSELTRTAIETGLSSVEGAIEFGAALRSQGDLLRAELMTLEQRVIEQEAAKQGYLRMLGLFVGRELEATIVLTAPETESLPPEIRRPELNLFSSRLQSLQLQSELINRNNLPQFSLFLQSGFGRPALNFLSNDFEPYYIGGLRFSWKLSNFYTAGRQKELLLINQDIVRSEEQTFLFNTQLTLTNQNTHIAKMGELIRKDEEIIALRDRIVKTSQGQLESGVISVTEYKSAVVDADQARQKRVLHQIELLQLKNEYQLTSGN